MNALREITPARDEIAVSAIIPVGNRHADIGQLHADYRAGLDRLGLSYEMVFVLDGRRPAVAETLRRLAAESADITVVSLTRFFGESTALMAGLQHARGRIILTLPAYFQIESAELAKLLDPLESADLVVCERKPRVGAWWERIRRAVFHGMIAAVTGARFNDLGCGARAMKREVLEELSLYGEQHRFVPLLAGRQGFRVQEVPVRQSPRDRFEGHYRPREYAHRALDIFTVFFLVRFTKKPLRFFGMAGVLTFGLGALATAWVVIERLAFDKSLANRPALLLSTLLVVLGLQLFALGLLGELIIFTHARESKDYQVDEVIQFRGDAPRPGPQDQ